MTSRFASILLTGAFACAANAAEKKVQLHDLPSAVQKAVADQTKGAELKGLSKETEKGVTSYEVETVLNGKHRDLTLNGKGEVTSIEDETTLDSIPAAAKAAIEKKVAGGKITMVEAVTKGSATLYEAAYTSKGGRKSEVLVKPDGTLAKD